MIRGIDVSRWQGKLPWKRLRDECGIRFVAARATMGARGVDPMFLEHRKGAESIGALFIAYHLEYPTYPESVLVQADHVLDVVGSDTPIALDVEPIEGVRATYAQWRDTTYHLACELSARMQFPPIVYGSPSFLSAVDFPLDMYGCPLWLADWRSGPPEIPRPWRRVTIRQVGARPLLGGPAIDFDTYEGTLEELRAEITFQP